MILYTIGHSTRALEEFLRLLDGEGIVHVADVRAYPVSLRYPHFNREPLASALAALGVGYSHHAALGGRRTPAPDSPNAGWRNAGFRGYADHMRTSEFGSALEALLVVARETPTAVMCAEAVPWRCHRSLIADAVVARGGSVRHILDAGARPHLLHDFAVVRGEMVTYPSGGGGAVQGQLL